MNLRQIETFRAVMLSGGISDAARLLKVTQPGVSRTVKHLETQLGFRLFQRLKGRLIPTHEARLLFDQVQAVYQGVQGIDDFAQSLRNGSHATLRVACSPSLGLEVVPQALATWWARAPSSRFALEILPSPALIDALVSGQSDIGLCAAEVEHPMLRSVRLGHMDMVCMAPQHLSLGGKRHVCPADVAELPFIAFDAQTHQGQQVRAAFDAAGVPFAPLATVRFARTACSLVAAGLGVAFVDPLTAHHVHGAHHLHPIRPAIRIPVLALTSLTRPVSSLVDSFVADASRQLKAALAAATPLTSAATGRQRGSGR
jgi:DNA-binding transcriptional LysR family regulator